MEICRLHIGKSLKEILSIQQSTNGSSALVCKVRRLHKSNLFKNWVYSKFILHVLLWWCWLPDAYVTQPWQCPTLSI